MRWRALGRNHWNEVICLRPYWPDPKGVQGSFAGSHANLFQIPEVDEAMSFAEVWKQVKSPSYEGVYGGSWIGVGEIWSMVDVELAAGHS